MRYPIKLIVLAASLLAGCSSTQPSPPLPQRQLDNYPSKAQECMALAMYWEARGEGIRGMAAVGSVVMNRVENDEFPTSTCDVVYQGGESPPCQFSWWCDGKSDRPQNRTQWSVALNIADDVLAGRVADPTIGALFFHSTGIRRPWKRTRTVQIGGHVFYR